MTSPIAHATGLPGGFKLNESDQAIFSEVPGAAGMAVLDIGANVSDGDEVTIGGETFRVAIVNTDMNVDVVNGDLNDTAVRATVSVGGDHGLIGGDLIRVEDEIMRVLQALERKVIVERGVSGTTIATHSDDEDIFSESSPGSGDIAVGLVTTLTPAAFTDAFVADVNDATLQHIGAEKISDNVVVVYTADDTGGNPAANEDSIATTTDFTSGSNDVRAANMENGRALKPQIILTRVPTAAEVTEGNVHYYFPFTPVVEHVQVYTTSDGSHVAWDGSATVSGNRVTLDNGGSVDWSATETILMIVRGS